ncbi:immunoglobulin E-set domain-containing protein [Dictyostelium discoideum AX4]|uniref:Immunoglobulin E-set domain-containing protein n=1 Tax=Dictyostelium discoideum TaxID=44689 RepID=Q55GI6_DICDI|nr:immunoglobulin E-set domain-containing protein [Dictyostelium discoideum AX4]EAL73605.2 immunoglobulin E-set domain-containing protein [Dictyostelium discoideum AX4]|eukprot:XP_647198.2 immunoglobulin E-set domain-containing protein [Dictyostelium discoideum AX4]
MEKKLLIIVIIFLFSTIQVFCQIDYKTFVISNETYLSYHFPVGSEYFSSLNFERFVGPSFQLDFECITFNGTVCFSQINQENKKQLYGTSITYTTKVTISLYKNNLPTPIVSSPFQPPTKGGISILKGTYLTFSERLSYYEVIYPKKQKIVISDSESLSFDATNVKVNCPPGCGYQIIKWENGQLFNFSYSNPSVFDYKINPSNIIVNGSDFCDSSYSSNITIDGVIIPNSNYQKDEDSIVIIYIQQHTTKSLLKIETSNVTSVEIEIVFKPEPLIINSIPYSKGGLIILDGSRLSSNTNKNNNNIIIKIGNITCSNAISISNESITCNLNPGIYNKSVALNNLPVSVTINNITNGNTLLFNYGMVKLNPNKYSLPDRILQLNGDCLGNSNSTIVYLNGKETLLNDLKINNQETTLSFKIPDEFKSKLNVSIKVNDILSNEIQIDISFYASHSNEQPSTNGNTNIIFTLYNIKSENYNKIPSIIIIPEQIVINGVSVNSPTNQDVHLYSFLIPAGCGKKDIQIIIGSQSCLSSITYFEPIIKNCLVSGFDGTNGNIICDGSFGNKDYLIKSSVLFSNDEIVPPSINSTTFSFPLISGYHSDDLIFQMCGVQSKPFKLNISPSLKRINQSQMETLGGKFYILGEFFSANINCSVFCNDKEYEKHFENSKTISFDLQIPGPNDITCNYTFDNGKNTGDFKIEYPLPLIENTSSINVNGGNLTIYGKNFYNVSNIKVEVDNQLKCNNIEFINLNSLTCFLPPFNETREQSLFNDQKLLLNSSTTIFSKKLLLNVTFESKTWSGYIFQYSKEEIKNNGTSENSSNDIIDHEKNNNTTKNGKGGINLSKESKIIISVVLPGVIILIILSVVVIYRIRINRITRNTYVKKINEMKTITPEEKRDEIDESDEIKKKLDIEMSELRSNLFIHSISYTNTLKEQQMERDQINKSPSLQIQPQNNQLNIINNGEGSSQQIQPQSNQSNIINNDEGSSHQFQPEINQSNTINNSEGSSQQIQPQNNQLNIINNDVGSSHQSKQNDSTGC